MLKRAALVAAAIGAEMLARGTAADSIRAACAAVTDVAAGAAIVVVTGGADTAAVAGRRRFWGTRRADLRTLLDLLAVDIAVGGRAGAAIGRGLAGLVDPLAARSTERGPDRCQAAGDGADHCLDDCAPRWALGHEPGEIVEPGSVHALGPFR